MADPGSTYALKQFDDLEIADLAREFYVLVELG